MTPNLQYAIQLHQQGQLDKAAHIYQQLIQIDSRNSDAHNLLGAVLVAKKQYKEALKHLSKAVKLAPKYASAHYNLGKCYVDMGEPKQAMSPLKNALRIDNNMVDAWFVLANCQVQLGLLESAATNYEKVIAKIPQHVEALNNLGNTWQDMKQPEKAVAYHQQALKLLPNFQLAMLSLAEAYKSLDRQQEAIDLLIEANEITPHADIYQSLGVNYQQIGNMELARQCYLSAIQLNPTLGEAYRGYTEVHKVSTEEDFALIRQGEKQVDSELGKAHWSFAMGHCLDNIADYGQAIDYYNQGNSLHRKSYDYSIAEDERLFKAIKSTYTAQEVSLTQNGDNQGEGVIFVLGMPRSGTTLVETIISSHSNVTGAGELSKLDGYAKKYKRGAQKFHEQVPKLKQDELVGMANEYLEYVQERADGQPFVTDKLPHNFLYIGLIRKLLPKAKIVHCKRHPVANCLSIYKAYFSAKGGHRYAFNQKELAEYHNLYEDLMEHWRNQLPDQFYEIKYEDLTSNQEEESRKLIEYCGLEWQDACLDFHKSKRKVKTASSFQVRQPMSKKSISLWKKYGEGLQPLIDNLYIPEEYQD